MKAKTQAIFLTLLFANGLAAQTDVVFYSGFEGIFVLNDTGITWAGDNPSGNNVDCNSNIASPQDCHTGRDATHNDDSDGLAGFSFTKLDTSGIPLVDQSVDYGTEPWACIRDNVTGLVWEVKTIDNGEHDKDNTYQWGGTSALGRDHPNSQGEYYDDWNGLINDSNNSVLCGFNNWRVPNVAELSSIVNKGIVNPSIDFNYFPNTAADWYWTASPNAGSSSFAWRVSFNLGFDGGSTRNTASRVRLVHSGL